MARIGIIACSNCTQDTNCAAVVRLADMRKRKGKGQHIREGVLFLDEPVQDQQQDGAARSQQDAPHI